MAIDRSKATVADVAQPGAEAGPARQIGPRFSLAQRFTVGLNVVLSIVAAAALLVLINWIAFANPMWRDWSSLGRYSLSQRTRTIVQRIDKPIRVTVIYNSQDPKKTTDPVSKVEYKARLMELLEELKAAGKDVIIDDVATLDQRVELANRLEKAQAKDAAGYTALIDKFLKIQEAWVGQIEKDNNNLRALVLQDTWVSEFESAREAYHELRGLNAKLAQTADKLKELRQRKAGTLTAYDEQADAFGSTLSDAVSLLNKSATAVQQMGELYRKLGGDDGGVSGNSLKHAREFAAELASLQAQMTVWKTRPPTSQPDKTIDAHFKKLVTPLTNQYKLLKQFSDDQPAILRNDAWLVPVSEQAAIGADEAFLLMQAGFGKLAAEMKQFSDGPEFVSYLDGWSRALAMLGAGTTRQFAVINDRLARLKSPDEASLALLDNSAKFLSEVQASANSMKGDFDKLPKMKLRGLSGRFKQENLLLVEVGQEAEEPKAIEFDNVWPQIDSPYDKSGESRSRTFNGDAAIGSTLFSLTHRTLAEVVFVHYAGQPRPNPMTGQPMPAKQSLIPFAELSVLRERLEQANVKVTEWNLAQSSEPPPPAYATEAEAKKAEEQPATQPAGDPLPRVYVVVPPPPIEPPNPYEPMAEPGFTEQHRQAVIDAIGDDGRAIFLSMCTYGQLKDEWHDYLKSHWGVNVRNDGRITQGIPTGSAGELNVTRYRWFWMLLNQFDPTHPVGKALNNRRVLLLEAAPIQIAMPEAFTALAGYLALTDEQKSKAEGLKKAYAAREEEAKKLHEKELKDLPWNKQEEIRPRHARELRSLQDERDRELKKLLTADQQTRLPRVLLEAAEGDPHYFGIIDFERISKQFANPEMVLSRGPDDLATPLCAMIESTRKTDDGRHSRIVVFSAGMSFLNNYLSGRAERENSEEGTRRESPPDANPEIVIDSVYYLVGQSKWIAAGPMSVPPINVARDRVQPIKIAVIAGPPLLVLLFGAGVILLRRRA